MINKMLLQKIEDYVGSDVMEEFRDNHPYDFLCFLMEIESKKRSVDLKRSGKPIILQSVLYLRKMFEKHNQLQQKNLSYDTKIRGKPIAISPAQMPGPVPPPPGISFREEDKLQIEYHVIRDAFDTVVEEIMNQVEIILDAKNSVSQLLLVGSFSESKYVQNCFREQFEATERARIVCPEEGGLAVLKGAVKYGLDPGAISHRILRYSYGIGVMKEFDKKLDRADKKTYLGDKEYCDDVFMPLARQGQQVKTGHQEKKSFTPDKATTTIIEHEIFVSTIKDPRHTTDVTCKLIGKFEVAMKLATNNEDRTYHQVATFGETEIRFEAHAKGKHLVTATLDFLG